MRRTYGGGRDLRLTHTCLEGSHCGQALTSARRTACIVALRILFQSNSPRNSGTKTRTLGGLWATANIRGPVLSLLLLTLVFRGCRSGGQISPDVISFNIILRTVCATEHLQVAPALLEMMGIARVTPLVSTYAIYMAGAASAGDPWLLDHGWQSMLSAHIVPDITCITLYLSALFQLVCIRLCSTCCCVAGSDRGLRLRGCSAWMISSCDCVYAEDLLNAFG